MSDLAHSNILLDMSPQAGETKEKNKQMRLHQTKKFLHSKGNCQKNKNTEWENIYTNISSKW